MAIPDVCVEIKAVRTDRKYFDARPWESIERWFAQTTFVNAYRGLLYIASGSTAAAVANGG